MRLRVLDRHLSDLGEVAQQRDVKDEHAWGRVRITV